VPSEFVVCARKKFVAVAARRKKVQSGKIVLFLKELFEFIDGSST
jgi:hypothetical protein